MIARIFSASELSTHETIYQVMLSRRLRPTCFNNRAEDNEITWAFLAHLHTSSR